MLLKTKCSLWDILVTFIVCRCKGLCVCRMNTKRGFSENQRYCLYKLSIVCRELFLLSNYKSSNYGWDVSHHITAVENDVKRGHRLFLCLSVMSHRCNTWERTVWIGWNLTGIYGSCDRLSDCLVLWDRDVVELHWAARDTLWGFCLLWNKIRPLLSSCCLCASILPQRDGDKLRKEGKDWQKQNHIQRSHTWDIYRE